MTKWTTTIRLGLGIVLLLAGLGKEAQGYGLDQGQSSPGGGRSNTLQLQGTVVCTGCLLNEVQEEHPAQADTFTQLSQGEEQVVVQVRKITDPPQEGTFAWPPPQLQVHSTGQVAEKLSAAAQPGQEVAIRGLLQDNHTLEVTDVTTSG
jgi:hypothetical protein